jgi:hypothetical protein
MYCTARIARQGINIEFGWRNLVRNGHFGGTKKNDEAMTLTWIVEKFVMWMEDGWSCPMVNYGAVVVNLGVEV